MERTDKLDKLLQGWDQRQKADENKLNLLAENICRAAKGAETETSPEVSKPNVVSVWWLRLAYTSLGAVASCLLIMTMQPQQQPTLPVSIVSEDTIESRQLATIAGVSQEDISKDLKIFQEVNHVFPEQLRWIQTSSRGMDFGLASEPGQAGISSGCVMVRIVIFKRRIGEPWQKLWTTEVTAVPEEVVQVPLDSETGGCIGFWTHHLPDGMLAVDSDIRLKLPVELTTSFSGIFKPGRPERVLSISSGDMEYCIFETANHLQIKPPRSM